MIEGTEDHLDRDALEGCIEALRDLLTNGEEHEVEEEGGIELELDAIRGGFPEVGEIEHPFGHQESIFDLRNEVATELSDDDYFSILEARSVRIQNRISPILKVLTFQGETGAEALLDALQYFKDKDGAVDKHAPLALLAPEERRAVTELGRFRVSLYKAFLFLHTQRAIKAGTLNLEHSYKYRPLDEYLIEGGRWQRDKEVLLERAGLQAFVDLHTLLNDLDKRLYQQYLTTNGHILAGPTRSSASEPRERSR
jgi:hypothetical protein